MQSNGDFSSTLRATGQHPEEVGSLRQPPLSPTAKKNPSCKNCKARKVKCDRRTTGCDRCSKLRIPCSYLGPSPNGSGELVDEERRNSAGNAEFTQAGYKRRRTRRACQACRGLKIKCTGTRPCPRCEDQRVECLYADDNAEQPSSVHIAATSTETPPAEIDGRLGSMSAPSDISVTDHRVPGGSVLDLHHCRGSSARQLDAARTGGDSGRYTTSLSEGPSARVLTKRHANGVDNLPPDHALLSNRSVVRQCLDAFFSYTDPVDCIFLHRASLLSSWHRGTLNPDLLQVLCAMGLRIISPHHREAHTVPFTWAREVKQHLMVLIEDNGMVLDSLQALVLLVRFHFTSNFNQDAWVLLAVAARVAFTMRLNYERPAPSAVIAAGATAASQRQQKLDLEEVQRELRRRLMWAIFVLDKLFSGGIEDLTVCPTQRLRIRLPSHNASLQRGLVSQSPFLRNMDKEEDGGLGVQGLDASAQITRLFDLRDRILRYTRGVILDRSNPAQSERALRELENELWRFRNSLSPELQLNPMRLSFMAHSDDSAAYMVLHSMWFLSRCDLHRFLIPGIRESVSIEVFKQVPKSYIDHCQSVCLETAVQMCELWSDFHDLGAQEQVHSHSLAISIYQCVHVLGHVVFRMPPAGPHALDELKHKLSKALSMVSQLGETYIWLRPCITDIIKLIASLGRPDCQSTPTSEHGFQNMPHARSKHGYVRSPSEPLQDDQPPARETGAARAQSQGNPHTPAGHVTNSPGKDAPPDQGQAMGPLSTHNGGGSGCDGSGGGRQWGVTFDSDSGRLDPAQPSRPRGHGTTRGPQHAIFNDALAATGPTHHEVDQGLSTAASCGSQPALTPCQGSDQPVQSWLGDTSELWLSQSGVASFDHTSLDSMMPLDPMELMLNSYATADPLSWAAPFSADYQADNGNRNNGI